LGKLKAIDGDLVHLQSRDFWLPVTAIETIEDEKVRLRSDYDFLGGPKQGGKSMGIMGAFARLAIVGLIAKAAMAYRDDQKRKELMSKAKGVADKAKTQLNNVKSKQNGNGSSHWTSPTSMSPASTPSSSMSHPSMMDTPDVPPAASSTSASSRANPTKPAASTSTPSTQAFSTMDMSDRTITMTETEITAEVTRAFPESTVRANAIGVHRGDGGEVGTLRFTVDEKASSDIDLSRLESPNASAEVLAQELITDLRSQLPQEK
jgi:hypothetical protein